MGFKGLLKHYKKQIAMIDTALEKTGRALGLIQAPKSPGNAIELSKGDRAALESWHDIMYPSFRIYGGEVSEITVTCQ